MAKSGLSNGNLKSIGNLHNKTTGSKWSDTQDSLTESSDDLDDEPQEPDPRLSALRQNVTKVILNSTILPFRWLASAYRCFYCYDIFEEVSALKAHNLLHEREEIKTAMQKYWENDVYVDITDISCTICLESFAALDDLVDHLMADHDVDYDKNTPHCFKQFLLKEDAVICGVCNASFNLFTQLLQHVTGEHKNPKDYQCDICGRSFKKHQYKRHMYNEHRSKNVTCTQCGDIFSAYTIRTHMVKVHNRRVKCKMCNESFSTHYKKQQHMTTVHRSREEFKCPHCPNVYYFRSTMNRHVKEVHLRETNVICNVCGWKGYALSRLKLHMVTHSEVRSVPCTHCSKMFKSEQHMKQHCLKEHDDDDEESVYQIIYT